MTAGSVFIVDDNPDNLGVLSAMLREAGYVVRVATSGRRALTAITRQPPDIVLLDITMPELDGFAICERLKAEPATREIPVIFLSALDDVADKVAAFGAGGVDYVTKPFHAEEVLARVASQLRLLRLRREIEQKNRELEATNTELVAAWSDADRLFAALSDLLPGTVLDGRYRLDQKIGAGGSAAVYRAWDLSTNAAVAVKILRPQPGGKTERWRSRFFEEWSVASRVSHPNAVVLLDSGVGPSGLPYIAMELLEGETLADEIARKGPLPVSRVVRVLTPVCEMLADAHRSGLVHRDIKPANIFLHRAAGTEVVKVVDFGLAKVLDEADSDNATTLGRVLGTPGYMAPERLLGRPTDGRADVYGVAMAAYEALAGRLPFAHTGGTAAATILAGLTEPAASLSEVRPDVPPALTAVLMRSLAREPDQRPHMEELASVLRTALADDATRTTAGTPRSQPAGATAEQTTAIINAPTVKVS